MGLFDWLRRVVAGSGRIRVDGITKSGKTFTVKMDFEGNITTEEAKKAALANVRARMLTDHDEIVEECHIVSYYYH